MPAAMRALVKMTTVGTAADMIVPASEGPSCRQSAERATDAMDVHLIDPARSACGVALWLFAFGHPKSAE
jgi:hypothetical protein